MGLPEVQIEVFASPDLSLLKLRLEPDEEEYLLGETTNVSVFLVNPFPYQVRVNTPASFTFSGKTEVQFGVLAKSIEFNPEGTPLILEPESELLLGSNTNTPRVTGILTFESHLGPYRTNCTVQILESNVTKYGSYSNLTVTPATLELGENVTISFEITNILRRAADFAYAIHVEGPDYSYEIMGCTSMEGYETKTISHIEVPDAVGTYTVSIGEMEAYYIVVSSGDSVNGD